MRAFKGPARDVHSLFSIFLLSCEALQDASSVCLSVMSQSMEKVAYFQAKPGTIGGWEEATPTFPVTHLLHTMLTPWKHPEHLLCVFTLVAQLNLSLFTDHWIIYL